MNIRIPTYIRSRVRRPGPGDEGVSPIVATLVLIVVAIIGAAAVALIMGSFSSNVSDQANSGNTANSASMHILLADSPYTYPVDMGLTNSYSATNTGVVVSPQNSPNEDGSITAVGLNIADIAATSHAPTAAQIAQYPNLQAYFVGGRAIVIIAHVGTVVPGASLGQSDMLNLYNNASKKAKPAFAPNVTSVVRDTANDGVEAIFAGWMTDGAVNSLNSYTYTPNGTTMYSATSEADVLNYVATTSNSTGFIDWEYLQNNPQYAGTVSVIPVLNKVTGLSQSPTVQNIQSEISNMDNAHYDAGLCRQLYYITNGQPDSLVNSYINWARTPASNSAFNGLGLYSATDLGTPTNVIAGSSTKTDLMVYAAASLYNSFNDIKAQYQAQNPNVNVVFNFDSSGTLQTQIQNGATPDVFASAATTQMVTLTGGNYVNQNYTFAKNQLALIVPKGNPAHITKLSDLAGYSGHKIVIADSSVPVGTYTRNMLTNISSLAGSGNDADYGSTFVSNFYANIASNESNVNSVVAKVALGEADAGIAYQSDVPSTYKSSVTVITIPWWDSGDASHTKMINQLATYPIATLKSSNNPYAQSFINYTMSTAGQTALQNDGLLSPTFTVP